MLGYNARLAFLGRLAWSRVGQFGRMAAASFAGLYLEK
jgi:hypothetical protein